MNKFFRILVLISICAYSIYMLLPYFWHLIHSDEIIGILELNGYKEYFNFYYILNIIFALTIVASFGLLFYKKWARTLFSGLILITIILVPFTGFSVATGFESSLGMVNTLSNGAILYMAYFSSVSNDFT